MEHSLVNLVNSGQDSESSGSLTERWEVIENAKLDGEHGEFKFKKRNGLDKRDDCIIDGPKTVFGHKDAVFAVGKQRGAVYDVSTDKWGAPFPVAEEYKLSVSTLAAVSKDYRNDELAHAITKIIKVGEQFIHIYALSDRSVYIDLTDLDGRKIRRISEISIGGETPKYAGRHWVSGLHDAANDILYVSYLDIGLLGQNKGKLYVEAFVSPLVATSYSANTFFENGKNYKVGETLIEAWVDSVVTGNSHYKTYEVLESFTPVAVAKADINALEAAGKIRLVHSKTGQRLGLAGTGTTPQYRLTFVDLFMGQDFRGDDTQPSIDFGYAYSPTPNTYTVAMHRSELNMDDGLTYRSTVTQFPSIQGESHLFSLGSYSEMNLLHCMDIERDGLSFSYRGIGRFTRDFDGKKFKSLFENHRGEGTGRSRGLELNEELLEYGYSGQQFYFARMDDPSDTLAISVNLVGGTEFHGTKIMVLDETAVPLSGTTSVFSYPKYNYLALYFFGVEPVSKPFLVDGRCLAFFKRLRQLGKNYNAVSAESEDLTNSLCFLLEIPLRDVTTREFVFDSPSTDAAFEKFSLVPPLSPVAAFAMGENVPSSQNTVIVDGTKVYLSYFSPLPSAQISSQSYNLLTIDVGQTFVPEAIEAFGTLLISGNIMKEFDGKNVVENNFLTAPEIKRSTIGEIIGVEGIWYYLAIYTHVDSDGNKTYSKPSAIFKSVARTAALSISNCPVSLRDNIEIEIYRTVSTTEVFKASTVFRKVGSLRSRNNSLNQVAVDGISDDEITNVLDKDYFVHHAIYSNGGNIVANEAILQPRNLIVHNGRVFFQSGIDNITYYSKVKTAGSSIAFSPIFSLDTSASENSDDAIGRAGLSFSKTSALGSMTGYLVLFQENSIFAVAGDGANVAGKDISFGDMQLVSSYQGCKEPKSVISFNEFIIFKGLDNWYLLNRGLSLRPIGWNVQSYFDSPILSSVFVPEAGIAYYLLGGRDEILAFDHLRGMEWYQNKYKVEGITDLSAVSGKLALITSAATSNLFIEGAGYKDNSLDYDVRFTSQWLKSKKKQIIQRISRLLVLGAVKSAFTYTLKEYADYNNDDAIAHPEIEGAAQVEFHIARQKGEATKFELIIKTASGSSEAIEIEDFMVRIGVMAERFKIGKRG